MARADSWHQMAGNDVSTTLPPSGRTARAVEELVRRCLLCPVLCHAQVGVAQQAPPHEAREELLRAILDELYSRHSIGDRERTASNAGSGPVAATLAATTKPGLAASMALADL